MIGTYCAYVEKFERGQLFRRYCVRCTHNMALLGYTEFHCQHLEHRITYPTHRKGEIIPGSEPSIRIPVDLR